MDQKESLLPIFIDPSSERMRADFDAMRRDRLTTLAALIQGYAMAAREMRLAERLGAASATLDDLGDLIEAASDSLRLGLGEGPAESSEEKVDSKV